MKKILDSNICIYAPQPAFAHLLPLLIDPDCAVSEITRLEVLGFHKLTKSERTYYEKVFLHKTIIPISKEIIDLAIQLRQSRKMTVGDAIIASTAIRHKLELVTRNTSDFANISDLVVSNPV
ncbi:MAG TPA: type II toxin-antitoxin system VapC family toxin [Saprospiraceae bacterium]|nr:type II toxin-antitoxin system VapC family toxin [Saprospiraceae bacterium]